MAEFQKFRSALGGFHREDVVHYIEYINSKHTAQVNQLKTQIQNLQSELDQARKAGQAEQSDLLEQANSRIAELEKALEEARNQAPQVQEKSSDELEAYRRAERAESRAAERVAQLYQQANGVLAEAALQADASAAQVGALADNLNLQLQQLLEALAAGKSTMQSAAAAMYAVRPLNEE